MNLQTKLLTCALLIAAAGGGLVIAQNDNPALSGGATTVFDTSTNAYSLPANNLGLLRRDSFFIGNAFFRQPWVTAPSSTTARDGLGPLFNTNSCQGCHVKDGRGRPPLSPDEGFISALVRLSLPADPSTDAATLKTAGVVPHPVYGDQLQPSAIRGLDGEGRPRLEYEEVAGQYDDGTPYSLIKPILKIDELAYGELGDDIQTSVRVAPMMIGMGLLDSIPQAAIEQLADPDDADGDGISGRPNQVWDALNQQTTIGRFGWKANQPNVAQQSAGAFNGDMGITSSMFSGQPCTPEQSLCAQAPHGGEPEISDEIFDKVVFYSSTLAVPARRDLDDPQVIAGEKLFEQSGCASCHVTTFETGEREDFPELANQIIHPYTDLLLHDMGEGLADGRPDFAATGSEWRTAPLWGIGLVETVNGHTRFLHDGRARSLLEAVLWHGGEAESSRDEVLAMNAEERDALVRFLESL